MTILFIAFSHIFSGVFKPIERISLQKTLDQDPLSRDPPRDPD